MAPALAQLAGLALSLPLALGGEAETSNSTGIGVISVASIVLGYVGLFALWYFVFRDKSRSKRKKDSSD
ncbi:MAG: hypothetical protein JWN10_2106 [Solirubrobacterales bacterium]|nr:hypothetical protein [Solirubrobacterales bacterium]